MEPRDPIRVEDSGEVDALLRSTELSKPEVNHALDRPALGRDPFADRADFDPFAEGLAELGIEARQIAREPAQQPPESTRHASEPAAPEPTPLARSRRRWSSTPRLAEIEPPDPSGLLERWLGPDERRRLAALQHLVENEVSYDRFGMSLILGESSPKAQRECPDAPMAGPKSVIGGAKTIRCLSLCCRSRTAAFRFARS